MVAEPKLRRAAGQPDDQHARNAFGEDPSMTTLDPMFAA
jgi:hypothetical protein